ncbi:MAG: UDP-N-acetylglucosamine 1-carboxyvinyltransferase, partial [Candidatus Omnitrophota bacterium]|nr:UDP-N-acetylglucosamine 1-carboxyvinyltransferase [Candidatus Omnitrophota bacterium]
KIFKHLGIRTRYDGDQISIEPNGYKKCVAPYELVSTMRASICVLGPLLAKHKHAEVSFPGGCVIGPRPIDLHLKGLKALNADIRVEHGYIVADGKKMRGANVYLGGHFGSSVLATANTMMAATLTPGVTVIENAACEPEVVDVAAFLIKMGARIKGYTTHRIIIEGVKRLHGAEHTIIPDRIEAGTYMVAAAITRGDITLKNAKSDHMAALIDKLTEAGLNITKVPSGLRARYIKKLKPVDVTTLPYPGFPTDMQAQLMSLMTITDGISVITEKIYPDRFIHISEMGRMGADIILEGPSAIIKGVKSLSGAPVMASDLRASAALVLAGLVAKGRTDVHRIYHLDRGYENLEKKLAGLGAKVWRERE